MAAGAGSRLWPYTETRPKPMVPVAGRPILGWLLEALAEAGIEQVQIVVGYKAGRIQSAFEDGSDLGLEISYVRQEVLLGSAAALSTALQDGGVPEAALVLGGDNIVSTQLIEALVDAGPGHLAVARTQEPSKYGVVTLDDGRIQRIKEKPPIQGEALVSTGVVTLDEALLEQVPDLVEEGLLGLAQVLDHLVDQGHELGAVVDAGTWLDAVHPWDLLQLTDRLVGQISQPVSAKAQVAKTAHVTGPVTVGPGAIVEPGAIVRGPASIGANARVQSGAIVSESVLMEDATVAAGAIAERSIIGDASTVNAGAILARGQALAETAEDVHRLEDMGAMIGEGCTVEGGATVLPGAILGNEARVRSGATARRRVPRGGEVT